MNEIKNLLNKVKVIAQDAANEIYSHSGKNNLRSYNFDTELNKEAKSTADIFLEKYLLSRLSKFNIPILSEESGLHGDSSNSEFLFILDPLDGTFNYVRDFGPSAISVALFKNNIPQFGVIYDLNQSQLIWGGKDFGAFINTNKIMVSRSKALNESVICSGFPVRYDMKKIFNDNLLDILCRFAKVRMIGSVAISLSKVASGIADAYFEKNIMLWDIAAGIAIIEGAGGKFELSPKRDEYSYDVLASNKDLFDVLKEII